MRGKSPALLRPEVGADGRHGLELVDRDGSAVACFRLGEVAGYAYGHGSAGTSGDVARTP